jgi:hypothetical protein
VPQAADVVDGCQAETGMTENVFELSAFLQDEGVRKPLYIRIDTPLRGESDYYCDVHAPAIFSNDKRIYGVDCEQATDLAIKFIGTILEDKKVTDLNGQPVRW